MNSDCNMPKVPVKLPMVTIVVLTRTPIRVAPATATKIREADVV